MLKEAKQTDGQRLLKQLREEYRRPAQEDPQRMRAKCESSEPQHWLVEASHSIN